MKLQHKQVIPNYPCKTVIYGVHGTKGGTGKSTAIANTAKWLRKTYPNAKIAATDIDAETSTFSRLTNLEVVEIKRGSVEGMAKLIELAYQGDSDIILFDSPASSLDAMRDLYSLLDLEQLKELQIRMACHCVINPTPDSLKTAREWLKAMPNWMINTAFFNKMVDLPEDTDPKIIKTIEDHTTAAIWIPEFNAKAMEIMDKKNLTWDDALDLNEKVLKAGSNESEASKYHVEGLTNYPNLIRLRSMVANLSSMFRKMEHILLPDQLIDAPVGEVAEFATTKQP